MSPIVAWAGFAACLLLILYSGTLLSRYGNMIAVRTGMGGAWVGLVLVAVVTSLPELVSGLSSVLVVVDADLAVGGALGSCVFNLLIIVVLDFIHRPESIYTRIHHGHVLSAGFGIILLGLAAGSIALHGQVANLSLGPISLFTPIAVILYAIAIRSVFFYERRERETYVPKREGRIQDEEAATLSPSLREIYARYAANAAVVMAAGIALPAVSEGIAGSMGWDTTFVGTIFMAFATSVPEIVVSVQAVRIAAVDMAIGNLLGSNLFDLLILAIEDAVFLRGPLLGASDPRHLFTALAALTMTGIVVVNLTYRPKRRAFQLIGWGSLALVILAILNGVILVLLG